MENGANDLSEALERLLGLPDIDDPPAIVGWTGGVRENPLGPVVERIETPAFGETGTDLVVLLLGPTRLSCTIRTATYCSPRRLRPPIMNKPEILRACRKSIPSRYWNRPVGSHTLP